MLGERNSGTMATPNNLLSSRGTEATNIVIVGGGVAGLATAIALHRSDSSHLIFQLPN